ncbi:redoxin domain-containing protein [Candidatus Haliotispira prima]|uniref:Redoxin domain-containing protein n=1 Tax=Candidatus Haliotispira prima TaxID=3034016 RepID=A0ABY8MH70_9SPIO|nr:redoxin domain-containing protein [Candidatus Haliotispira prima]
MGEKLVSGDRFPLIQLRAADNVIFNPSLYFGKRIFYSFFRFTGCPACNLYFNQIQAKKRDFEANNIILVGLFEMELEVLKDVLPNKNKDYWGIFLADPIGKYYDQCGLERSSLKLNINVLNRQFHQTMHSGKEVMLEGVNNRHRNDADGKKNRMPAQFLVDKKRKVLVSHYGKSIFDRMPLSDII